MVVERYHQVLERIEQACQKSARASQEVHLLAVTKTFPVDLIVQLFKAGQRDFGENYVQEAESKVARLPQANWHMIGPLQSNKARTAVSLFSTIHSLDRLSLAQRLEQMARAAGKTMNAFVQIRLGEENSKSGLDPADLMAEMQRWSAHNWQALRLVGLMTLPPPQASRPYFARLRQLRDQLKERAWPMFVDYQLSMGMSDDFEDAIAEGSNWIRIGRALFGSR
ncbi:YggS family pyridoxal phosphate-dependent enzyme [bacterium]|nr:YggS family pyridoxal phosphate-dependent enzyme [bacterium]